jgi:hypothetical protein
MQVGDPAEGGGGGLTRPASCMRLGAVGIGATRAEGRGRHLLGAGGAGGGGNAPSSWRLPLRPLQGQRAEAQRGRHRGDRVRAEDARRRPASGGRWGTPPAAGHPRTPAPQSLHRCHMRTPAHAFSFGTSLLSQPLPLTSAACCPQAASPLPHPPPPPQPHAHAPCLRRAACTLAFACNPCPAASSPPCALPSPPVNRHPPAPRLQDRRCGAPAGGVQQPVAPHHQRARLRRPSGGGHQPVCQRQPCRAGGGQAGGAGGGWVAGAAGLVCAW